MEELHAAIGSKRVMWEDLTRFIGENFRVQSDFIFYGKNYGWTVRFRKGGKALVSLYPGKEGFTAQIILGQIEAEKAAGLSLGANVRGVLESSKQFFEGRWLFIKVESKQELDDVKRLILTKSRPVKKGNEPDVSARS